MATDVEKHVQFFDTNNDGVITLWETYSGFRRLGYNIPLSIWITALTNGTMSYSTQDSWMPDPFFRIIVKNIHYCKHGSDTGIVDNDGNMNEERLNLVYEKFAKNEKLGFFELWRMTDYHRCVWDFYGYMANKLEWGFTWLLQMDRGYLTKDDMKGVIDGSLFYKKEAELKQESQKDL